jgi:hypothetical protein
VSHTYDDVTYAYADVTYTGIARPKARRVSRILPMLTLQVLTCAAYDAVAICVVCMPDVQVWHAHQALGASMRQMHIMLSAHHWLAEQLVKPCI